VSRTTDGGVTWQSAVLGPGTSLDRSRGFENLTVHFRDRQNGVVLFAYGDMADYTQPEASLAPDVCESFSTSDGGATWSAPTAAPCLAGATFVSRTLGYGHLWVHSPDKYSLANSPDLYVTTDGGRTWTRAQLPEACSSPDSSPDIYFMQQRKDGTLRALCGAARRLASASRRAATAAGSGPSWVRRRASSPRTAGWSAP
jgi:hypothetical protein